MHRILSDETRMGNEDDRPFGALSFTARDIARMNESCEARPAPLHPRRQSSPASGE